MNLTKNKQYDIDKIFDVVLAFNGEMGYEQLLNVILSKMMDITDSDAGTLYIAESGKLHFRIVKNRTLNISQSMKDTTDLPPVALGGDNIENVSAYAANRNEIVVIDDVYEENGRFNFAGPKNYDRLTGYRTQSMLVLPLSTYWDGGCGYGAEVMGVIQLMNAADRDTGTVGSYGDVHEPPVIPALANVAANALANLVRVNEVKEVFHSIVSVLTHAIDERSSYNSGHTKNVARYCRRFASYLSSRFPPGHEYFFDDARSEQLVMAAMLHDIGKIITPLEIMDKADRLAGRLAPLRYRLQIKKCQLENDMLSGRVAREEYDGQREALDAARELIEEVNGAAFLTDGKLAEVQKLAEMRMTYTDCGGEPAAVLEPEDIEALSIRKGSLTDGERRIMQQHAELTGRLLDSISFWRYYKNVPEIARNHHEFLDGTGYPRKLTGGELSVESCIITIADIFEALTASDRPYKKALPAGKSVGILNEMAQEGKLHADLTGLFAESAVWEYVD